MSHTSKLEPLWFAPQRSGKSGWICFKDSPSPPPPPDYAASAQAQGAANIDTARVQARLSNPNVNTPYGSQTVTYGQPQFDQAGYDAAMAKYNAAPQGNGQPQFLYHTSKNDFEGAGSEITQQLNPNYSASAGVAPTREQFMSNPTQDTPTVTQTLNPQSQQVFDAQQRTRLGLADLSNNALGTAQNVMGSKFNYGGPGIQQNLDLSGVAKMPVNAGTTGQEAIMARLRPQLAQDDMANESRLANQGIGLGSEAYNNAMRVHSQGRNDLISQAALQGLGLDFQANNQGFNQGLASAQFGNTANQQDWQRQLYERNLPLNEISALMSGSQIQNPQFSGYQGVGVQAPPVFNAAQQQYNAGMQGYGNQTAGNNAFNSGLFQLGGAALGSIGTWGPMLAAASDRRLKSNIVKIGEHPLGIGIYSYDIFGKPDIGVMADEVLTVKPEAVLTHPSGFLMVDYGRL